MEEADDRDEDEEVLDADEVEVRRSKHWLMQEAI